MMDPKKDPKWHRVARFGAPKLHLKKGKFYISVKVPPELRHLFPEARIRRSTGTSDKVTAEIRAVEQVEDIYRTLERAYEELDPFIEALRPTLEVEGIDVSTWYTGKQLTAVLAGEKTQAFKRLGITSVLNRGRAEILKETWVATNYHELAALVRALGHDLPQSIHHLLDGERDLKSADNQVDVVTPKDTVKVFSAAPNLFSGDAGDALLGNLSQPVTRKDNAVIAKQQNFKFSELVEDYLAYKAGDTAEAQRRKACERALEHIGDLPVDEYDRAHAYDWARAMHSTGASSTQLKKMIRYASGVLEYATTVRNPDGSVALKANPWRGLDLRGYGVKEKSYFPFSQSELEDIFALSLPTRESLLFSILVTTGMRLDEAALMTWERIFEIDGVLCFSLKKNDGPSVTVKNKSAERYIPVPEILKPVLGTPNTGRLFNYRIDDKGKAENHASKAAMAQIRKVTQNKRKVTHSFRHSFKDFLRSVEAPLEEANYILGHELPGMGSVYGTDLPVKNLKPIIDRIQHPWLRNK